MRVRLRRSVHSTRLKIFGVIGTSFLEFRKFRVKMNNSYRDVFFDGNEKIIIRNDERNPGEGSKKYKVNNNNIYMNDM